MHRRVQIGCDPVSMFSAVRGAQRTSEGRMQVLGDHSAERARFDVGGERQEFVLPKQRSTGSVWCVHSDRRGIGSRVGGKHIESVWNGI